MLLRAQKNQIIRHFHSYNHLECRLIPAWEAPPSIHRLKLCHSHILHLPLIVILTAIKQHLKLVAPSVK